MQDPQTFMEWVEAAAAANALLLLDAARVYGLVTGGPDVDTARCEQILAGAEERGITPNGIAVERYVGEMVAEGLRLVQG